MIRDIVIFKQDRHRLSDRSHDLKIWRVGQREAQTLSSHVTDYKVSETLIAFVNSANGLTVMDINGQQIFADARVLNFKVSDSMIAYQKDFSAPRAVDRDWRYVVRNLEGRYVLPAQDNERAVRYNFMNGWALNFSLSNSDVLSCESCWNLHCYRVNGERVALGNPEPTIADGSTYVTTSQKVILPNADVALGLVIKDLQANQTLLAGRFDSFLLQINLW